METKYRVLKTSLEDLGYFQPLMIESIPLVDKLLSDLIQTTDSLRYYKKVAQSALEEKNTFQFGLEPYKCDNAKLMKECNDLHIKLLKLQEHADESEKALHRQLKKLEKENSDLKSKVCVLECDLSKKGEKFRKPAISRTALYNPQIQSDKLKKEMSVISQQRIEKLTKDIDYYKNENAIQAETIQSYKNQLANREKEIQRLARMLEGGRPTQAINGDCCYKDIDIRLSGVSEQITVIEQEKRELQNQLKESVEKQHEAMKRALHLAERNKQLEKELRDIDHMALAVEADCNSTVKQQSEKMREANMHLDEARAQVSSLQHQILSMKRSKQELEADLDAVKNEKNHLQSVLESTRNEKKKLNDRINQFTVIERDLNLKIDELVQNSAQQRNRVRELEKQLFNRQLDGSCTCKSERTRQKSNGENYDKYDIASEKEGIEGSKTEKLKSERDYYYREYQKLRDQLSNLPEQPDSILEIRRKLNEKEQALASLQQENRDIVREKHNLIARLESIEERNRWSGTMSGENDGLSIKTIIKRIERERDIAKSDVTRLEEELNAVRERLKIATATQLSEHSRLERALYESEDRVRQLENERRDLMISQGSRRATLSTLEEQVESLKKQLNVSQTDLSQQRALNNQLKTLQEQTDRALANAQGQLKQAEREIRNSQDHIKTLEREKDSLQQDTLSSRKDMAVLRGSLAQIDQEKDSLLMNLDEKTEKVVSLEDQLKFKDSRIASLETQLMELKKKVEIAVDEIATKEISLRNCCAENDRLSRELNLLKATKEDIAAENRRLQTELSLQSSQAQASSQNLLSARREADDLKRQLQDYVEKVKRVEDLLEQKEAERAQMLDNFRTLSQEAVVLESNNHSLENVATEKSIQLRLTEEKVMDLNENLIAKDSMIREYEKEIANLTAKVAALEGQVKEAREETRQTQDELNNIKDVCKKLDNQKDTLLRDSSERDTRKLQIEQDFHKVQQDHDSLRTDYRKARSSIGTLEELLASSRQETIDQKLRNQELMNDIQNLRSKIDELQLKIELESEKTEHYQKMVSDYQVKVGVLQDELDRVSRHQLEDLRCYPSL